MNTDTSPQLALARLLQLISPSLPIGGYTYSQGIEWAVEAQWIETEQELHAWLEGLLQTQMRYLELPLLRHMLEAWVRVDLPRLEQLNQWLIASRETRELRLEEANRARAFFDWLRALESGAAQHRAILSGSQLGCFSFACQRWQITYEAAALGLATSWIENLVLSAVKIIPLGQTAGQRVIFDLGARVPEVVDFAASVEADNIGASSMAMAIASAGHETQYTRLFRS